MALRTYDNGRDIALPTTRKLQSAGKPEKKKKKKKQKERKCSIT
jgi:hypothetical protein